MVNVLIAGLITSIIWFFAGGILYMNPMVKSFSDKYGKKSAIKIYKKDSEMMYGMFLLGVFLPSIIFALVYVIIKPALPGTFFMDTLFFAILLIGIKIIPRFTDMILLTTYPRQLLILDIINGSITAFVIAGSLTYLL